MSEEKTIIADDWDRICEQRDLADREWAAGAALMEEKNGGVPLSEEEDPAEYRRRMNNRPEYFADMYLLAAVLEKSARRLPCLSQKRQSLSKNRRKSAG